jgi:outer membrane protein OmpA-like peptidoglycan-associated protein
MKASKPATLQGGQTTTVKVPLDPDAGAVARTFLIHFTSNKAFVEPCMRAVLRQAIDFVRDNPDDRLIIVGHTDKVDTDEYNQSLSERRARSVYAFLTFGRDPDASLREWKELRQERPKGEIKTVKDSWGLRQAQFMLQDLGFYPGNVDGKGGPLTDSAVSAFRCKAGLPPGKDLDDPTWAALIKAYMTQDGFALPASRFLPNCSAADVVKWLGCGERDPVKNVATAWRPNRRVELLFVKAAKLPCDVTPPDTLELVQDGAGSAKWCLPKGAPANRACFVFPALPKKGAKPAPGQLVRQPVDAGTLDVTGTILRQARNKDGTTVLNPDGTVKVEPVPGGQKFFLIAADGEILASENPANGEPVAARTGAKGEFKFAGKRTGVYSLAAEGAVLARLAEEEDGAVKGNAVCKRLAAAGDKLEVVLINAPVLREIRLPVAVHLLTGLNSKTREPRPCASPGGGAPFRQKSAQTRESVEKLFNGSPDGTAQGANFVWRQARVRFDPVDVVEEVYQNPSRPSCLVDNAEMGAFFNLCAYPNTINVFFIAGFDDPEGLGEAGGAVSPEKAAAQGLKEGGCLVADRAVVTFGGGLATNVLDFGLQVEVLAHELGHFLSLEHVTSGLAADADRLMLPGSLNGKNLRLTQDEVNQARASRAARLACEPLTLRVTGAIRMGGARSHQFLFVKPLTPGTPPPVTVDAVISDALLTAGTVTMTGGQPGANDRQRVVSTGAVTTAEIVATYTPAAGGDAFTTRVVVDVANFTLRVDGNDARPAQPGSTTFITTRAAGKSIVVVAQVDPGPFCVPRDLVQWTNGQEQADPLRRSVPRDPIAATRITAKIGGEVRFLDIVVVEVALSTNTAPFDKPFQRLDVRGVLNSDRKSFGLANLFDDQPDHVFRVRADVPDVQGAAAATKLQGKLTSLAVDGTVIETRDVTLNRGAGDRFVSLPILAIQEAIPRADIQFKAPQSIEVLRSKAEGKVRLTITELAVLDLLELPVRGLVAELCSVTITGATTHPDRDTAAAQRVWAQAGIEVRVLNPRTIDRPDLLHIDAPSKQPDPDEIALYALGRDTCTVDIVGYYVKSTSPAALGRTTHVPLRPGFYVTDDATQYTLGHELGHVLGLPHDKVEAKNLMFEEGTSGLPNNARDVLLNQNQLFDVQTGGFLKTKP